MDFLSHEDYVNSIVGERFTWHGLKLSFLHLEGKALANITDLQLISSNIYYKMIYIGIFGEF